MKTRPAFDTLDLAWGIFASKNLPLPSSKRLLARGDIPADALQFFLDFYKISPDVSVKKEYVNLDHPAHVTITPPNYTMRINSVYNGWHDAESSIISHELVHVLMSEMKIEGRTRWEDEIFTDAFAVFLGAGLIANFRVSVDFYKDSSLVKSMGYLNYEERSYALSRFMLQANMSPPSHPSGPWRNLDIVGLRSAQKTLTARATKAKIKKTTSNTRSCPRCGCELAASNSSTRDRLILCAECGMGWQPGVFGYRCVIC